MKECGCKEPHARRRFVLTGGPGAGKTAVLELIRQDLCKHLLIVPEAAGVVFGGGFPRGDHPEQRRAAQRAIYHVQRELESNVEAEDSAILLCDRGTVDGLAYWVGSDDLWAQVGTTLEDELRRYDAVIHLRTPHKGQGYNQQNPLRIEDADEAFAIDQRIASAWSTHPRRHVVEPTADFLEKADRAIRILRGEMPECCRGHLGLSRL